MINFVCWKWEPKGGGLHPRKGIRFTHQHVNILYSMLERNISSPFQLHCITDNSTGINEKVRTLQLWDKYRDMGGCYVRLPIFNAQKGKLIGEDFFSIDLDVVILKDITGLVEETRVNHDFKIWGQTNPMTPYNGSFFYMRAGARAQVADQFHPISSPKKAKALHYFGSDQAHISACLGVNEAMWTKADGIYSYRCNFQQENRQALRGDEKIVFFHGSHDPSKPETQKIVPWIKDYWT